MFFKIFDNLKKRNQSIADDLTPIYINPYHKNLVQFKHACLNDYPYRNELTNLESCSCSYFNKYQLPCWHMQQLALESGIYKEAFEAGSYLDSSVRMLSDGAFKVFAKLLYSGYYDNPICPENLGKYKNVLLKSGLIIETEDTIRYSPDVIKNIYYVLHVFFTDNRVK